MLLALVRATVPAGKSLRVAPDKEHLVHQVGLVLASMPRLERLGVRTLFWFFEHVSVLFCGHRFSAMEDEAQDQWVRTLAESQVSAIRLFARLILTVVKPAHFSHRRVQMDIGYPAGHLDDVEPVRPVTLAEDRIQVGLDRDLELRCQVAVIGTGAGGAVVACELAEKGIDVVMVEAGPPADLTDLGRDPGHALRTLYQDGATTLAYGRPSIPVPLGRTVGGTTTINSGTCFRTPDSVLDRWEQEGLVIDRGHLSECFDRVEQRIQVQAVPDHLLGGSSKVVARGAEAMGLEHGPLSRNIDGCLQSGACAFGCPRNAKQSANITYVPWALEAGARLVAGVRATQLLQKGGRVAGLRGRSASGRSLTVHADLVVSSCGAITGVPFLRQVGLRSPHLGRHLTIHPGVKIVAQMPEVVNGWQDTPQGYGLPGFFDEGLMFEGAFVPPEYTAIAMPFVGRVLTEVMEAYPHLAMFGFMVADEPVGQVHVLPGGKSFIRYMLHKKDQARVQRGLGVLSELFFAAGAERIFLPIAGREEQCTLAQAQAAISKRFDPMALEMAAFHPLGTARMSAVARKGVVDPDLESWEIPGLYVVDGGVVPSALGVNPQITIMGLATRAATTIARRLQA